MDPPLYPLHIPRVDPTRAEAETLQQSSPLADGIKLQKKDNPTPPPVCVCAKAFSSPPFTISITVLCLARTLKLVLVPGSSLLYFVVYHLVEEGRSSR